MATFLELKLLINLNMNVMLLGHNSISHSADSNTNNQIPSRKLLYIILDLRVFSNKTIFQASHAAISARHPNTYDCNMVSAITTAARMPSSLKQLTRLAVRAEMKDVIIIEDSYKLPLPACLQDYVSLRNLEATIRSHYIVEKPLKF